MSTFAQPSLWARISMAILLALSIQTVPAQTAAHSICQDGKQDVAACERELSATQHTTPSDPNQNFAENALKRCQVFAKDPEARQSCEDRVRNQNTKRAGSVFGGGTLQEHRIIQTAPAPRPVQ